MENFKHDFNEFFTIVSFNVSINYCFKIQPGLSFTNIEEFCDVYLFYSKIAVLIKFGKILLNIRKLQNLDPEL